MHDQIREVTERKGPGDLRAAIYSGNTWEVD